jgi:hypothetical protein
MKKLTGRVVAWLLWILSGKEFAVYAVAWGSQEKGTLKFRIFKSRAQAKPFIKFVRKGGHVPLCDYITAAGVRELETKARRVS